MSAPVFSSRGSADVWRQFSRSYDAKVLSVTSFPDKRRQILEGVTPGVVLDAGCGPLGLLLSALADRLAVHAIGFDFCEDMLLESRRHTAGRRVEYVAADLRQLPFSTAAADTIVAVNSFVPETRDEASAMFGEVSRALKPGGRLVAVLPSFEMSLVASDRWGMPLELDVVNQREWDTSGWQCFYTSSEIERLMKRHQFSSHAVHRLTFASPQEIAHIQNVYSAALAAVPVDRLRNDPLFEHLLIAER